MTDQTEPQHLAAPERVYRELRREILEGNVAPGERLTTLAVAERLGVSRTPVRAALLRLEADGLVESDGGRSARVRGLSVDEVEHAYDVAMGLEGMLVYRLAQEASDEQRQQLLETVDAMEAAAKSGDRSAWVEADERFHTLLPEFGGNQLLAGMMHRVETIIGRLRFLSLHVNPQGAEDSAHDHHAVVDAIRRGDAEGARRRHHEHWERVRSANISFLREGFSGNAGYLFSVPSARRSPGKEAPRP